MGRDTMEATREAFEDILNFHASRGTTLAVLTTVASSLEEMERLLVAAEDYQRKTADSRLAGIHLEGPYFSPYRRGAHRAEMLRHPSACETKELLRHAEVITRMTLAPELPGSLELIRILVQHGIAASAGHSNATEEEALEGFQSGCTQVTHLYNCMSSLRSEGGRRHTGLAEAALTREGILCEVIADGRHLSPSLLRLAWLSKSWESVAIVSDATAGAGLPEGSSFELGGLSCVVEQGAAWTGEGADRRLAGSTIGTIDGVRVMVEQVGVPMEEAVAMASLTPARSLGVDGERGSLEVGKRADLLQFSPDWQVEGVWLTGIPVG
jgi:N-acetylglucosamine-6-phosphate deacetylase